MKFDRRAFLALAGSATVAAAAPRFALAASLPADTRLLVVLLRGGVDGLHVVQPLGDPAYAPLRAALAQAAGQPAPRRLDADFSLHGSLDFMSQLYARKQLLPVLAVAPPYRQRSHFDAQDCVENGTAGPGSGGSGWLNRCVGAMPGAGGLAVAASRPLIARGPASVDTWSPPLQEDVDPVLWQRLQVLYAKDPRLAAAFDKADAGAQRGGGKEGSQFQQSMAAAARFMSAPKGPRIGFVADSGWDSHRGEAGLLGRKLPELDAALRKFHDGAQAVWANTVVAIVTEFGRTAAVNGTGGTDHGTGGMAFLAGGAVNGGRIAGDWPGLAKAQLNEGRDLRTTTDMRSLFKGVLRDHLRVADATLAGTVFPDSGSAAPMRDLLRA